MRKMHKAVTIFVDLEEAECELDRHYAALTPNERMREMVELLRRHGVWDRPLERVVAIITVE